MKYLTTGREYSTWVNVLTLKHFEQLFFKDKNNEASLRTKKNIKTKCSFIRAHTDDESLTVSMPASQPACYALFSDPTKINWQIASYSKLNSTCTSQVRKERNIFRLVLNPFIACLFSLWIDLSSGRLAPVDLSDSCARCDSFWSLCSCDTGFFVVHYRPGVQPMKKLLFVSMACQRTKASAFLDLHLHTTTSNQTSFSFVFPILLCP